MKKFKGTSVSKGIAFGYIKFQSIDLPEFEKERISDTFSELNRFNNACADTMNLLQTLYERTIHIAGEENARIFSIQQMFLQDSDYVNEAKEIIKTEAVCAEYAVYIT